jgi:hypothetical protein
LKRSLGLLTAGGLIFWLLIFYPARLLGGDTAVIYSAVAGVVCLVPAGATLLWGRWAFQSAPEQQLLAVLGGTGVRMVLVIGVGIALFLLSEYFHQPSFLVWLIVFYLVTLALEISLLLMSRSAREPSQQKG